MRFSCGQCNAQYLLPDEKIGERGVRVRCKRCDYVNTIERTTEQRVAQVVAEQPTAHLELGESTPVAGPVDPMDSMFDAIFDPSGGQPVVASLAADEEPTLDPAAPNPSPMQEEPTRDWWVAIDNQQVGPLSRIELESRVASGTVTRASLVWKTGMANWTALADVPELGTLIGRAKTEVELNRVAGSQAAVPEGVHLGQSESVAPEPIEWKPSAATQLSELVQAELKQGRGASGDAPEPSIADVANLPAFSAPSGGSGFTVEKKSPTGALVLLGVLALAAGLYAQGVFSEGVLQVSGDAEAALQSSLKTAQVPAPVAPPIVVEEEITQKPAEETPVEPKPGIEPKHEESKPVLAKKKAKPVRKARKATAKSKKKKSQKKRAATKPNARDDIDDVFEKRSRVPAKLVMSVLTQATKKNSASIRPCIRNAIDSREVTPGRHSLELSFVVLPNGRVKKPKMAGPYYLQGTSLPKCLTAAMRNWRYPKSKEGNRVEKFPIPFKYNP